MGNANHAVQPKQVEGFSDADHAAAPRGLQTSVSEACDTASCALFEFSALIGDPVPSRSVVERERAAHLRLDKTLLRARLEPCSTVSDGQAKCVVFQQLRQVFPPEDKRLHDFAIHVLAEIADLLGQIDGHNIQ